MVKPKFSVKLSKRWALALVASVVLIGGGISVYALQNRQSLPQTGSQPESKEQAKEPLDPILIQAIKERKYSASPITTTQNLGNGGGYYSQVVSFISDGLTEYALKTTPLGSAPAGGWPVVILCHGYIAPTEYSTTRGDYQSWIADLTRAGYVVIKPDYRGHGQSQGVAEGGHFSPAYTYDVLNLIESLKAYDGVNANKIAVVGHSMGAHVALRAAVVSKDIKASIYVSGVVGSIYDIVYNWPRPPYVNDRPQSVVRSRLNELQQKHGDPKSNPDFWNQASAINYVKDIVGPIQIHHGGADDVVPPLFSEHLTEAAKKANKPVDYYVYPGGDHQFSNAAYRQQMLDRIKSFLNQSV